MQQEKAIVVGLGASGMTAVRIFGIKRLECDCVGYTRMSATSKGPADRASAGQVYWRRFKRCSVNR